MIPAIKMEKIGKNVGSYKPIEPVYYFCDMDGETINYWDKLLIPTISLSTLL